MDRVMEIGGFAAGYCGRMLVRAGADVVRVESDERIPAWASPQAMDLYLHAGKRRVACADADVEMLARLAEKADVIVCEAANADDLLALGFDEWSAPVKLAITPFGRTGPKRNWHATPSVILAMAGYTHIIGDADRAPLTVPGHYVEFQAGALGYAGINACRLANSDIAGPRDAASVGANVIDIGMLETVMALSQFTTVRWHCAGELRTRHGSDFWFVVPSNLFACADGWVYLNIVPTFWDAFTVFVDMPELLVDERFEGNDRRMANRDALHALITAALAPASKGELVARAEACRVPLGVVQSFDEVLDDPHLSARNFWEVTTDPQGVAYRSPGLAFSVAGEPRPQLPLEEVVVSAGKGGQRGQKGTQMDAELLRQLRWD